MPYADIEKKRKADREYHARKRRKHLELGLCVNCHREAMFGYTRCEVCNRIHAEYDKKSRPRLIKDRETAGVCVNCGCRPSVDGSRYCLVCKDKGTKSRRVFYGTYK